MAKGKGKSSYLKKAKQFAAGRSKRSQADNQGASQTAFDQDDEACQQFAVADSSSHHNQLTATSTAVVGLTNLGNTCFFNSSVQILLACVPLQHMLLQPEHHITKGPLGYGLQQVALFAHGRNPAAKTSPVYNPQSLLSAVCCYAPVFKGKQQHDSHELMRMLLDGLQMQEARYKDLSKRGAADSSSSAAPLAAAAAAAAVQPQLANGTAGLPNGTADSGSSGGSSSSSGESTHSSGSSTGNDSVAGSDIGEAAGDKADDTDHSSCSSSSRSSQDLPVSKKSSGTGNSFVALVDAEDSSSSSSSSSNSGTDSTADESSSSSSSQTTKQQQEQHMHQVTTSDPGIQNQVCTTTSEVVEAASALLQHANGICSFDQEQRSPSRPTQDGEDVSSRQHCEKCNAALDMMQPPGEDAQQQQQQEPSPQYQVCQVPALQQQQQPQQQGGTPLARKSLLPAEPPKSAGSTSVDAVFGGMLVSTIACTVCGHVSVSYEPFLDLSLPIPIAEAGSGSLSRKGSLLSRLANRTSGAGKANKSVAEGAQAGAGAAVVAKPDQQQQHGAGTGPAAAALAAALASGKKLSHKERRKLRQAAQREAKEQKKLERLAAKNKQQQQQDVPDDAGAAGQPAESAAAAGALGVNGLGRTSPAVNGDSSRDSSSSPVDLTPQQQQQQQGHGLDLQQQQQRGGSVPPSLAVGRVAGDSDGDSAASAWADLGNVAASPPTSAVGCFGAGMHTVYSLRDLTSPKPLAPGANVNSSSSSTPGFKPIHRRFSSLGSLSAFSALSSKGGLTSLFGAWQGRSSKDGSASDTAAAAAGQGNSSSGQGCNVPVTPPPRPASALGFTPASELNPQGIGHVPELNHRAGAVDAGAGYSSGYSNGGLVSPARGFGAGLNHGCNGMNGLCRAESGGSVSSSSVAGGSVAGDSGFSGSSGNAVGTAAAAGGGGGDAWFDNMQLQQQQAFVAPGSIMHGINTSSKCVAATIPEDCAVTITPFSMLNDSQRQQMQQQLQDYTSNSSSNVNDAVVVDGVGTQQQQQQEEEGVEGAASPCVVQARVGSSAFTVEDSSSSSTNDVTRPAAAAADNDYDADDTVNDRLDRSSPLPPIVETEQQEGEPLQDQQQQQAPPRLLRANSDDFIVRMGSLRFNSSGGGAGATPSGSSSSTTAVQLLQKGVHTDQAGWDHHGVNAAMLMPPAAAAAAAAANSSTDPASPFAVASANPFEAAAAAGPAAPLADPFAAAAVASRGEALGLQHCMATFFLREEITWECPREKALWKESRRVSISEAGPTPQAAAAAACADGSSSSNATGAAAEDLGAGKSHAVRAPATPPAAILQPDEGCPIIKQVSFSEQHPQVILVPGSVEQRGTDLQAALAGVKPFTRAVTWQGAALLLTAQLQQGSESSSNSNSEVASSSLLQQQQQQSSDPHPQAVPKQFKDGSAAYNAGYCVSRVLRLGLKAAGEGNGAAAAVLPGGKAVQLGSVQLPSLEGVSAAHQASLVQTWAQLLLNCMADLVTHEGGLTGLQSMLCGQITLLRNSSNGVAAAPMTAQYLDGASEDGEWKIRGQLPLAHGTAAAAAAAAPGGGGSPAEGAGDGEAVAAAADAGCRSSSPSVGGYWEYPAADDSNGLEQQQQQQQQQEASAGDTSRSRSSSPHEFEGNGMQQPQQGVQRLQLAWQSEPSSAACNAAADAAAEDDGLFVMDDESNSENGELQEQLEQAAPVLQTQAWEGDAVDDGAGSSSTTTAAAAGSMGAAGCGSDSSNGISGTSGDHGIGASSSCLALGGTGGNNSSKIGSSIFRKVHMPDGQEHPAAAAAAVGNSMSSSTCNGNHSSSKPVDIAAPTQHTAAAAAASAGSPAAGTPSSLRRSSLRRKSVTFNRTAHKAYRIHLAPQVLLLHLKRFQHDGKGRMQKLDTQVKFDFEVNLAPFMATAATAAAAAAAGNAAAGVGSTTGSAAGSTINVSSTAVAADQAAEAGLDKCAATEPTAVTAAVSAQESSSSSSTMCGPISWQQAATDSSSLIYDLVGVVVHMGTMRGGHYVAYVKRSTQQQQQQQQQSPGEGSSDAMDSAASSKDGENSSSSSSSNKQPGSTGSTGGGILSGLVGGGKSSAAAAAAAAGTQWYYVSDSSVKAVSKSEVANAQAYMLMYVRRGSAAAVPPAVLTPQ